MKKDRLSIHIENGQADILEAITLVRNGGTPSQSGLVGITNKTHTSNESPVLPETILNIQATGDSIIRSTSLVSNKRNKIELLSNNNTPASGMTISHQKIFSTPSYEVGKFTDTGGEISFLVHQSGTTAIGDIRSYTNIGNTINDLSIIDGRSVLLISKSGDASNSGTIAIREQTSKPLTSSYFGKLYVKPYIFASQTQSLFFMDDAGNEFNTVPSIYDSLGGSIYGDANGNTYAGWYTPRTRAVSGSTLRNTYFGHSIDCLSNMMDNVLIGYQTGSGVNNARRNTIVGNNSFTQLDSSSGNIIIGYNNLTLSNKSSPASADHINNSIIIGNDLYIDNFPQDFALAIGTHGTPLVTGLLKGPSRKLSILSTDSEVTRFTINRNVYDFNAGLVLENGRYIATFGSQDTFSTNQARSMLSMRFQNSLGASQTLVDYDPSGLLNITNPTWTNPTFKRPTVSVSGDLRVLGAIRFPNGSTIDNGQVDVALNFIDLPNALDTPSIITTTNSYLAMSVPSGTGNYVGKITLQAISDYVGSGFAAVSNNCNHIWSNVENNIDKVNNSNSIFIGCEVGVDATGWKHGIFIGTNAGRHSKTPNVGLGTDTACIYIGFLAGYGAINTNDIICLGNSAGRNADNSNKSIFIGLSAGQNSTNPDSIGIGAHALEGALLQSEGGSRNIEIIAGLDDNQRLMYTNGALSDRLNIQNTIAANTNTRNVSIGNANLNPQAVLEVIRDTTDTWLHDGHTNDNIQRWINNGSGIARVDASGSFIKRGIGGADINHPSEIGSTCDSWFGTHEGFMSEYIYAPTDYMSPTSGWMVTRTYENGFGTDRKILVINRDPKLNIHGPGATGGTAFVITQMVNGEHRPIYVSCSG